MEYYDNLTFDPDRGVYLDKDGYPLEARNGALSQPDVSNLVSSYRTIFTLHTNKIVTADSDTIEIDPFVSSEASITSLNVDAIHPVNETTLEVEQTVTTPGVITTEVTADVIQSKTLPTIEFDDPIDVATSVTTPQVNTDTINAVTGAGPIQVIDPINVATSVTTPALVGTASATAPSVVGTTSVTTPQVNASTNHLTLQAVGATDRIKIGNSTAGKLEVQPGLTNQQIQATTSDPNSDITLIPKGIGVVSCSTYFLHVDSLTSLQTINLSGTSPIERVVMSNVVTNTFPASILTWVSNDRIQNNSGRTLVGLISSDTRGEWQGSWPNALLGYGYTAGTEVTLDKYWYGTLRISAPSNSQPQQSISGCSIIEIKPGEQMSVWIRAVSGQIIIGTSDITRLAYRNHMTFKLLV